MYNPQILLPLPFLQNSHAAELVVFSFDQIFYFYNILGLDENFIQIIFSCSFPAYGLLIPWMTLWFNITLKKIIDFKSQLVIYWSYCLKYYQVVSPHSYKATLYLNFEQERRYHKACIFMKIHLQIIPRTCMNEIINESTIFNCIWCHLSHLLYLRFLIWLEQEVVDKDLYSLWIGIKDILISRWLFVYLLPQQNFVWGYLHFELQWPFCHCLLSKVHIP
jgi:hypothetical protein